jgi:hypothetical protein
METFLAKLMEAMIIVDTMLCRTKTNETENSQRNFMDLFPRSIFESLQALESTTQLFHTGRGLEILDLPC